MIGLFIIIGLIVLGIILSILYFTLCNYCVKEMCQIFAIIFFIFGVAIFITWGLGSLVNYNNCQTLNRLQREIKLERTIFYNLEEQDISGKVITSVKYHQAKKLENLIDDYNGILEYYKNKKYFFCLINKDVLKLNFIEKDF